VVLELDGITAHVRRYRPRGVDTVVTRRSDALEHRRLGALVPRLTDGEDVEMQQWTAALLHLRSRVLRGCQSFVAAKDRGRVPQVLFVGGDVDEPVAIGGG